MNDRLPVFPLGSFFGMLHYGRHGGRPLHSEAGLQEKLAGSEKERYINRLFATIAPRYDLLNSVISLGNHKRWRKTAVRMSGLTKGGKALDAATGTGDFAIDLARVAGESGMVVGIDFCLPMLEIAARKIGERSTRHAEPVEARRMSGESPITLAAANAESLPFESESFDCATIGFALRNVSSVPATIAELARVVKPGGRVVSLEMVRPTAPILTPLWRMYFFKVMPALARIFGAEGEAYDYLPRSVARFYSREELAEVFRDSGLSNVTARGLMLGLVCIHMGIKQ